jgi:hypothetical protein
MARKIFFSFHYERDIWRVNQVRNSWVVHGSSNSAAGWIDHPEWESVRRTDSASIKRWIDRNLDGSSVTVVCIGAETAERNWVLYEIEQSHKKGNGLLGIRIHNSENKHGQTDHPGLSPFMVFKPEPRSLLSESSSPQIAETPIYNWKNDNGWKNLATWVERAAQAVGR